MKSVDIIENAIWEGFEAEDNACVDRSMDLIDTGGTWETFNMRRVAEHVHNALRNACLITTAEQLDALPVGSLIRTETGRTYRRTDHCWVDVYGYGAPSPALPALLLHADDRRE